MPIESRNPFNGNVEATFDEFTPKETRATLDAVAAAWPAWRDRSFARRGEILLEAARVLRERRDGLAVIMAKEMGKPVRQGRGEVEKCASVCEFYARNAEAMLATEPVAGVGDSACVMYQPQGTVLAVMPWNFPFWQVFRIAAPSLMAGNCMVLKHASNVPQCALAVEEIFRDAGLPAHVFRTLLIGAGQVEAVLDHASVIGVSLTGSDAAGRKVAAAAGARLKKSVMELGGSDAFIVLADADLDKAAGVAALSRCGNTGQTCIAAKRFIVLESVFNPFVSRLSAQMSALRMGDPLDEATDMGPMSAARLREDLRDQVRRCQEAGGKVLLGGEAPEGPGFFYPPTILADVPPSASVCQEEFFGPVALLFRVADAEEAVALANATPFGLGGSVWTANVDAGLALAARIRCGAVFVNGLVRSDANLPFGGTGASGFGRELSVNGIREFVNVKSVCVG
ncbi:MAG: NAD-dependent succinate-semialdehyde dehydrogenase [Desulfovibrio sp.]